MDFLRFAISKLRVYSPIVPLLEELLTRSGQTQILDLCAGGGGGIIGIQKELEQRMQQHIGVTLSDLYPNIPAFKLIQQETNGAINYIPQPIDATGVPPEITGCRTIFSAFHHFSPQLAQSILQDAATKRVPIGIFEGAGKNYLEVVAAILFFPIVFFLLTPFMRPFRWSRLIFTYLVPLIPLCTIWDGCVSIMRLYTPEHLLQLTRSIAATNYTWRAGKVKHKTGLKIIYLIGYPT